MTNRPTDDFDDLAEDQASLNNPDEDDAAFGSTGNDARRDDRRKDSVDDSDFVEDDMADVADELADELDDAATGEYSEEDLVAEEDYDTTEGDEAVEYDIIEDEDTSTEDNQRNNRGGKDDGKRYFGKYKKNDLIFYGILAVGGILGLILIVSTALDTGAPAQPQQLVLDDRSTLPDNSQSGQQQPVTQAANISGMLIPDNSNVPTARELPATAPEPTPDGIGVAGAISTLKDDTMAPVAEMPAAVIPPQEPAPSPVLAEPAAAPLPSVAEVPPTPAAPPVADEPLAPVAQVTAPPSLGVDNTSLAERMSEMGVKLAELNARLTQINDSINGLQTSTTKLDQQSQDLVAKTSELGARVDQQNVKLDAKLDEAAKQRDDLLKQVKEVKDAKPAAPTPTNTAALDDLKISIAQLERRVANMGKGQGTGTQTTSTTPRQPQSFDGPPPPAATPTKPTKKPTSDTVEIPAPPQQQTAQAWQAQRPTMREEPRSPKARAEAGLSTVPQAGNTWVLRAATPNMAWLSPRPGSAELRRVAIGDAVEGLGQIQAIRQEAGRWVVVGTEATVR